MPGPRRGRRAGAVDPQPSGQRSPAIPGGGHDVVPPSGADLSGRARPTTALLAPRPSVAPPASGRYEGAMRVANPLRELEKYGQSVWYDSLRRGLIASGQLARFVVEDGLKGLTTNPAIYEKAIDSTGDYDAELATLLPQAHLDAQGIYDQLAIHDIQAAADLLRPVHDASGGRDGFVSLEVAPVAARDERATLAEAPRL